MRGAVTKYARLWWDMRSEKRPTDQVLKDSEVKVEDAAGAVNKNKVSDDLKSPARKSVGGFYFCLVWCRVGMS